MKTLLLLMLICAGLLQSPHALAEDSDSKRQQQSQDQMEETLDAQELPPAQIEDTADNLIIHIGKTNYSLEETPNIENMKQALGLTIPDSVKEHILQHGGVLPPDSNPLEGYQTLSDADKVKFQKVRHVFLQNAARILSATKFASGIGSIVGDSFRFVKRSIKNMIKKDGTQQSQQPKEKITFGERSNRAVQATLQALDYKLWNQAVLLLDSNEFGVAASVGLFVENGVLNNGMGGSEEVGVSIAYNKEKRAGVFEIYHNSENFKFTPAVVTAVGVMVKAGPQFGHKDSERPAEPTQGISFYPPMMPVYSTTTPSYFSAGFSTSVGYPPNPLVDMMTYTNKLNRNTLLRVTVSPFAVGFVRIYFGNPMASIKLVVFRFVGMFHWVTEKIMRLQGHSMCRAVYL